MRPRPKLTYANVVATLALVLALGGGTVYAAIKLGKNDVKSRNIARGAVQGSDLAKQAVTSPKVKDGSIKGADLSNGAVTGATVRDGSINGADLAAGVFEGLDIDVTGSAAAGPKGGVDTNTTSPLPLSGRTTFTPRAGEVTALAAEGRFTIASTDPTKFCSPAVFLLLNGQPTRVFVNPTGEGNSTTPVTTLGRDADGPFGLLSPGTPQTISAEIIGDEDCTPGSQLNRLEIRILQIR